MKSKTNYRLKNGDLVVLLNNESVTGYWFDPDFMETGSWESHSIVKGTIGKVIFARTPYVFSEDGRTKYFANIDVSHLGVVSRVRVQHSDIKRITR